MGNKQAFTGKVGRSQVVSTFGVGAIYELRSSMKGGTQALNSVMIAGLDQWDQYRDRFPRIRERHLERVLGKKFFLAPPIEPEDNQDSWGCPAIPVVRFPRWLVCNACDRLGRVDREFRETDTGPRCRGNACGGRGVPVRIVMACYPSDTGTDAQPGHIEDFPWGWWAHKDGRSCETPQLKLITSGKSAGLAGLRVECHSAACKPQHVGRTLEAIWNPDMFEKLRCRGQRPWLRHDEAECSRPLRALMRGASNVYFPVTPSALSIPPNSGRLMQLVGRQPLLMDNYGSQPDQILVDMAKNSVLGIREAYSDAQIIAAIQAMATGEDAGPVTEAEQRQAERTAIIEERNDEDDERSEFKVERVDDDALGEALAKVTAHLVLADRLREVRVLRGFHRVRSLNQGDAYDVPCAPLSRNVNLDWLPAVEVYGEGIYFELCPDLIEDWEARDDVKERIKVLYGNISRLEQSQGADQPPIERPPPRLVLVHTLCHLLINQFSLDCGYSSASLRERLYAGGGGSEPSWAGFLIYTASPGADGTLGGLVRQGRPEVFERTMRAALLGATWCSSDPLCIESRGQGTDALNLSACHACCIVSETSCEKRNLYLDRGLLVGTPGHPDAGLFVGSDLVS